MHSQAFVPQINVRITDQHLLWLESEVRPFRNKSVVIRDLIDSRIDALTVYIVQPTTLVRDHHKVTFALSQVISLR